MSHTVTQSCFTCLLSFRSVCVCLCIFISHWQISMLGVIKCVFATYQTYYYVLWDIPNNKISWHSFHSVIITSFQIAMLSASVTLASSLQRDLRKSVTAISKEIQRRGKQKEEEARRSKYLWRGCRCSLAWWCGALKYINKHSKQSAWIFYMLGGQRQ